MKRLFTFFVATLLWSSIYAQEVGTTYEPISDQNTYFDVSKPLRDNIISPKGASAHHQWTNGEVGNLVKEKHYNNLDNDKITKKSEKQARMEGFI